MIIPPPPSVIPEPPKAVPPPPKICEAAEVLTLKPHIERVETPERKAKRLQSEIDSFVIKCLKSYKYFAAACLTIKTKTKGLQQLKFNRGQRHLNHIAEEMLKQHGMIRIIIVKGRQQGLSTWVEGRGYWKTSQHPGVKAYILAHEIDATKNLFNMAKRFHDHCPAELKPITKKSNAKELIFNEMESEYAVGTAKTGDTGRSQTIQFFHGCLAEGTQVLTPMRRVKAIEDFEIGDYVVTHKGHHAPISFISKNEKECFAVKLKGHHAAVVASAAHEFVTTCGKIPLGALTTADKLLIPVKAFTNDCGLLQFAQPKIVRPQGGGKDEDVPRHTAATYELGKVLGLYLAEGSIKRQYKSHHEPCAVTFTVHEDEVLRTVAWLRECSDLFSSISVQPRNDSKSVNVVANGKSFAMFVEGHCGSKASKHMQSRVFRNADAARGALHGYLAGDGHFEQATRRVSATSIREALTYGMREAAAGLGYGWASVAFKPAAVRHGRNERDAWTFRLTGAGVDKLASEMGEKTAPRKRSGNYGGTEVTVIDGAMYAEVQIKSIQAVGKHIVYDFEVDHPDHSYCLPQCAVSNSEVAYWEAADEISSGAMEGIPEEDGTEVYLESTAKGTGGYFHSMWQAACYMDDTPPAHWNGYWRVFVPWFWEESYRHKVPEGFELTADEEKIVQIHRLDLNQLAWRRRKIAKLKGDVSRFQRDYPADAAEAFNSQLSNVLIKPDTVLLAMQAGRENKYMAVGRPILGVDVAREGDDDTTLVLRQGRVIMWYRRMSKLRTLEVASAVVMAIKEHHVSHVCIDATGGYGAGVYDVLVGYGFGDMLTAVGFGDSAIEDDRYKNRRAEMYWHLKEWLEAGASIPDKDEWLVELCAITYKHDATSDQLVLERKDEIRKRIGKSTDVSDAAALTFCMPSIIMSDNRGSFDPHEEYGVI